MKSIRTAGIFLLLAMIAMGGLPASASVSASAEPLTAVAQISQGSDDAEEESDDGEVSLGGKDLDFERIKDDGEYEAEIIGLRFQNLAVPQGAVITEARLSIMAEEKDSKTTTMRISAEDTGNAGTFRRTRRNITSRATTSAVTVWENVPRWYRGTRYATPDLSPVVQEVVDRQDWQEGNAIAFIVHTDGERDGYAYESGSGRAVRLEIAYVLPQAPQPQCADGQDNDDDGLADAEDPGCMNAEDDDETDPLPPPAQCADGIDNDQDGLSDAEDPGCFDANDDDETDPLPPPPAAQCADGLDNDGDSKVDLDDPGCSDANDNNESDDPLPPPPPPPADTRGMVSLVFDDGLHSTYAVAKPILETYGFKGTVGVYPSVQDGKAQGGGYEDFMSWDEVRALASAGWEIANHSYSHAHLASLSDADLKIEIDTAHDRLASEGLSINGFISPYGEYDDRVLTHVATKYAYHRNAYGGTFNAIPSMNDYNLNGVEVAFDMATGTAGALIEQAVTDNTWLILYWHDLVDGEASPYTYRTSDFAEIIAYLAARPARVVTLTEGLSLLNAGANLVPNGSFEDGAGADADFWTRNDTTSVNVLSDGLGAYPHALRSVKIDGTSAQMQISSDPVTVTAGAPYVIKAFWNMRGLSDGGGNLWVSEFDSSNTYIGGQWLGGAYTDFVGTRYMPYTPSSGAASAELFFYTNPGSILSWRIDNVVLREQ